MVKNQVENKQKKEPKNCLTKVCKKQQTSEEIVKNFLAKISCGKQKKDSDIPLKNVVNALKIIDAKDFSSKEKVFVYFASFNLLNKYAKQEDIVEGFKDSYYFKKYIGIAAETLANDKEKYADFYGDSNLFMVDCLGMEFSFHNIKLEATYPPKNWIGLKLQPYANAIFELFYSSEFAEYDFEVKDSKIAELIDVIKNCNNYKE